ncbi:MAG: hypothetical protein ACHQ51_07310 [Elusimicrobiota bacterium]
MKNKTPDSFREGLFGGLRGIASPGRSSRYDVERHAILQAPALLAEAAALNGDDAEMSALRARLLRLAGRNDDAAAEFERALDEDRNCPEALAGRWELRLVSGKKDDGISRAIDLEPKRDVWHAWRGLKLVRRNAAAARKDFEKAGSGPAGILSLVGLHACETRARRAKAALVPLDAAVRRAPREGWLYRLRSLARLRAGDEKGFVADAEAQILRDENIGVLTKFLDRDGPYDPRNFLALSERAMKSRGRTCWLLAVSGDMRRSPEVGDPEGSLRDWEEAVAKAPRPGWLLAHLGRARQERGDERGAFEALHAAVAAEPKCGWIRVWLAEIQRKYGDQAGALRDAGAGLALDPDYEIGYATRGAARRALGMTAEALQDLEIAVALAPRLEWARRERDLARATVL